MLRENWNVLRLLNRIKRCQDTHRDIQEHNAGHHGEHFSYRTLPVYKNLKNLRIGPCWPPSLLTLFFLLLKTFTFPSFTLYTQISSALLVLSIFIFFASLSCLISSPPFLPAFLTISHFSWQYYLSTLCTYHQKFAFSCHHLSLATGEASACVLGDMQIYYLWSRCLHRQTLSKCDQGMMWLQNGKGTSKTGDQAWKQLWI